MAILDKKTTELPALPIPAADDLLRGVDDVAGTPTDKKVLVSDLVDSFTRTAEEISEGVVPLDLKKFPSPIRDLSRYVSDNTGVSDVSSEIKDAIDVTAVKGGEIIVPDGTYKCIDLILKSGVYLVGPMQGQATQSSTVSTVFKAAGAGTILSSDGLSSIRNSGVVGIGFNGLGAGTAVIGINFDDINFGLVRWCSFDNLSDQAILIDADCGQCIIAENFAQNCLLNRTRVRIDGVLDIDGTDNLIIAGEYTASSSIEDDISDINLRVCAITVRGGQTAFNGLVIGEISDVGIHVLDVTSPIRIGGTLRADKNYAHGVIYDGSVISTGVESLSNGQATASATETTLSGAEASGQTVLSVTSETGFGNGEPISIELDNQQWHTTTVVSSGVGTVTITTALPSDAASGSAVVNAVVSFGVFVKSGNGSHSNMQAISITADGYAHRDGIHDIQNSDTNKHHYDSSCDSTRHTDQAFVNALFAGASHNTPHGTSITFTDQDTTPSVDNYGSWRANNTVSTTITDFIKGYGGQLIQVFCTNTNTIFSNNANIKTLTVANKTSVANSTYWFRNENGVWREIGEPIALQTYIPSNDVTDRTWDANAAVSGTGIDVADAGPANVALLSDHDALVTVVQELSDVVATLTKDLTTKGSL